MVMVRRNWRRQPIDPSGGFTATSLIRSDVSKFVPESIDSIENRLGVAG